MEKRIKALLIVVAILVMALAVNGINAAGQALLLIESVNQGVSVGDYFTIDIMVDPHGATIDTVRANIVFPADKLQAVNFNLADAFPSAAPGNFIDNEKGLISEGGALLGGSVKDKVLFGQITFQAKKIGTASVAVAKGSRLIRAGKELINQYLGKATVAIGPAKPVVQQIIVQSATHPDSEKWYNANKVDLSWSVAPNLPKIEKFLFAFDENPNTDPTTVLLVSILNKSFSKVKDGIWYFHVKGQFGLKNFSITNHFRVMIDATKPNDFLPVLENSVINEGETAVARFSAIDAGSGIEHYELAIDDGQFIKRESPTKIDGLKVGKHLIMVRAFDFAGNVSANGVYVIVNLATGKTASAHLIKWWYFVSAGGAIVLGAMMWITWHKKSHQMKLKRGIIYSH